MPEDTVVEAVEETWPRKVGRGWNTSDKYRFFNEAKAVAHQERVTGKADEEGDG